MQERCRGQTKDGRACGAEVWQDGWCRWHSPDPEMRARVAEGRRRGGEEKSSARRAARKMPRDLKDVLAAALRTLGAVESGEMEPARANAVANVAKACCAVFEAAELVARVEALEQAAGTGQGRSA